MYSLSFALVRKYRPNKILAALYRYGAPPTVEALAALLEDDLEQKNWQMYVADMSCAMVKRLSKKASFPFYSDLVKRSNNITDSRSGQEIVNDLIARRRKKKLRGGITNETA